MLTRILDAECQVRTCDLCNRNEVLHGADYELLPMYRCDREQLIICEHCKVEYEREVAAILG